MRLRRSTVSQRRGSADWRFVALGSIASLGLASLVALTSIGCGERNAKLRWEAEHELAVEMPRVAGDEGVPMGAISPPALTQIQTQAAVEPSAPVSTDMLTLDSPASPKRDLDAAPLSAVVIDRAYARFTAAQAPSFDESDEDEDGGSASDRGPIEMVPTPKGAPEVKAEVVPTPQGIPETLMARTPDIAKAPKDSAGPLSDLEGPAPLEGPASNDATNPRVALIDATNIESLAPEDYKTWPVPNVALVVTGQQHGYIEPCGCTGLDKQKGGVARRMTFMQQLRENGWNLLPIDGGNQVRRFGRQAEIKFQRTAEALRIMDYQAVGFGPDDLRLGVGELISVAAGDDDNPTLYASANVVLLDPTLMPQQKVIESGGLKIGITSILDPKSMAVKPGDEILVDDPAESAKKSLAVLAESSPDVKVLLFFGEEDDAKKLVREVNGFDLMVVAGGYGEPTYRPELVDGSTTNMIVTGNKGMYAGLVGLYAGESMRYARVPLTHEFSDAPEMRRLMSEYQNQLRDLGLEGLGLKPIAHPSGNEFVGSEACGECHKTAYAIWQGTPHAEATESLVHPGERSDVPRHFDPECLSCHVTGWNAQNYYPYISGYLSLDTHKHLTGNGCENCHGAGSAHVAAENADAADLDEAKRDELRVSMRLPLDKARDRCMECHDLDNSPDFHEEGAFDDYWSQVEHYGKD